MANRTSNYSGGRPNKDHVRHLNTLPARAGYIYFVGEAATVDSGGFLLPGVTANSVRAAGVIVENPLRDQPDKNHYLDNTAGQDGEWTSFDQVARGVRYDRVGEYFFKVTGSAPKSEGLAYIVDSDTLSADPTPEGIVLGVFTRPHRDGWFVDVSARNRVQLPAPSTYYPLTTTIPDVSTAQTVHLISPIAGTLDAIYATHDAALATANPTVTFSVDAVPVADGDMSLSFTRAPGWVFPKVLDGTTAVAQGSSIAVTTDGASTGVSRLTVSFRLKV